ILIIAPHRVYLVSLQPNCTFFLLHWSSYRYGRMLSAMLPCGVRTFLPFFCGCKKKHQQAGFLMTAKIHFLPNIKTSHWNFIKTHSIIVFISVIFYLRFLKNKQLVSK